MSGPIIEELPDDFDVAAHKAAAKSAKEQKAPSSSSAQPNSTTASSSGGLRGGFLNAKPSRQSRSAAAPAQSQPQPEEVPLSNSDGKDDGAPQAPDAQQEVPRHEVAPQEPPELRPPESATEPLPTDGEKSDKEPSWSAGLRMRMQAVSDKHRAQVAQRQSKEATVRESVEELAKAVEALKQGRWPSSHSKQSWDKATSEIDVTLAELRSLSNDSRRLRSGEEKRAAAEFRRVAEDGIERLRKVAEQSTRKAKSGEDEASMTMKAFHDLPLVAKLRIMADAKVALVLLGGAFATGMATVFFILVEVYTAWGCSWQCDR